ncbi:MAG: hypothetical protein M1816_006889 [Peltula sp. TS41687]|nr:MAG: hypothetical protein M1816_006889 [Peltula sp. TS41687]
MTGRGDGRLFHPSTTPTVTIGLSLSCSPRILDPTLPSPFFLTVTARILTSPRPNSPITLATHQNALGGISNRSMSNIHCISPCSQQHPKPQKYIEIWPCGCPHYRWDSAGEDLRQCWSFVTIYPADRPPLEIRHEVDRETLGAAGLRSGERYRAELTDRCLGARWWMFGSLEEWEGIRFREWRDEDGEKEGEEEGQGDGNGDGRYTMGENPDLLALVIEKGEVEFEIG